MRGGENLAMARLGLWQAIVAALIAGLCGVLGSYLQFAAKQPATVGDIATTFDRRLPIGTVVPSVLAPALFTKTAGDPGGFDPTESVWVPADGRDVPGSAYAKYTSKTATPDLRGMFLRGLNESEEGRVRKTNSDPDGGDRVAGDFQEDAIKAHSHAISPPANYGLKIWHRSFQGENGGDRTVYSNEPRGAAPGVNSTQDFGGSETRPKNVAVYYYIKIN